MSRPDITQEPRRIRRYVVVRIVSRVGDVLIYGTLLYAYGLDWLIPAFILSGIFNYTVDFWGQKLWTFGERDKRLRELLREFVMYLFIRSGNVLLAGTLWFILHSALGVPLLWATIITIVIFWTISFGLYRWLFTGSIKDLLQAIRQKGLEVLKRIRS